MPPINKTYPHLKNKKIQIVTEVLFALGDFFAAKKLIKLLQLAAPDLELSWLVFSQPSRTDLPGRIEDAKNELGQKITITLADFSLELATDDHKDSDFILFLPTVHYITPTNYQRLKASGAPMVQVHEYDAIALLNHLLNKSDLPCVNSGFDGLGLFFDELDTKVLANTLQTNSPAPYVANPAHELFFSYLNQELVSQVNDVDFNNFLRIAMEIAAPEKSVDVIANSPSAVLDDEFKNFVWDHGFSEISFLKKNADNTTEERTLVSPRRTTTKRVLRLINPFPMSQVQIQALMGHAHPFMQVTGDQSLSELLSLGSLGKGTFPFYQTMKWKSALHDHMQQLASAYCGPDSPYVHLLQSTAKDKKIEVMEFASYWRKNQQQIMEDSLLFYQALVAEKNLTENFPQFLDLLFYITKKFPPQMQAANYALLAQLVVKIKDPKTIKRLLKALNLAENLDERTQIIRAMTEFLRLNPTKINEETIYTLSNQLKELPAKDRRFAAITTCRILTCLPPRVRSNWVDKLLPDLSRLNTGAYARVVQDIEKIGDLETVQTQANWFSKLIAARGVFQTSTVDPRKPILLAVHVYDDGVGDIAKFIGTYLHLRQTFPHIQLRSLIKCMDDSRPVILAMLRENGIPVQGIHFWSISTLEYLHQSTTLSFDTDSSLNKLAFFDKDDFSLIISLATPFKEINTQLRSFWNEKIPYIEIAEVNYCSYKGNVNWLTPADANHQIVAMGLSEEAVGLEITAALRDSAPALIKRLKPELAQQLLDGAPTGERVDEWLQSTFFMPAYLKNDQGILSLRYALTLTKRHFKEKTTTVVWVYKLPFDVTDSTFMTELKNSGIAKLVVHDDQGQRQEYPVPGTEGKRQFRIVCGRVETIDFDLMYQLAQHTGGFSGCVGQNSFEKSISFDLIPAFYAPPWQLAIIYETQSLLTKLFSADSKEYQCVNDYLNLLSTVSRAINQTATLQQTATFIPHVQRLATLAPAQFSMELQQFGRDLNPIARWRFTQAFGAHPVEAIEQFFEHHDLHLLQAAWRVICSHIKAQKNLNNWLVGRIKELSLVTQSVPSPSEPKVSLILSSSNYRRLTHKEFPNALGQLNQCLLEAWPSHEKQGLQLFVTDNNNLLVDVVPGMSNPAIAVSTDAFKQLSVGEMRFAIKLAVNKFLNYPVENVSFKNDKLNQAELLKATDTYLEFGMGYCRKMFALLQARANEQPVLHGRKSQKWWNLDSLANFYLDMIKNIELLLAKKHQNDLHSQEARVMSESSSLVIGEMTAIEDSWSQQLAQSVVEISADEILEKLNIMIPQLRIMHLEEYITPSKVTQQFINTLDGLRIKRPKTVQVEKLKALVDGAFEQRSGSFTTIYRLVAQKISPARGYFCIGPFDLLRQLIVNFSEAATFECALESAQKIEEFVTHIKYRNLFQNTMDAVSAEHYNEAKVNYTELCIWSSIGAFIDWSDFFEVPCAGTERYENYLKWSAEDDTRTLSMVLFRLGMINEKPLWNFLPSGFLKKLDTAAGGVLLGVIPREYRDTADRKPWARTQLCLDKFSSDYLKHRAVYTPRADSSPVTVANIESFIADNRISLELPEFSGNAAQTLIKKFELLLTTNPGEGKELVRRFYLDSSYPLGIYQLHKGRMKVASSSEVRNFCGDLNIEDTTFTSSNTIEHPYLHFLIKNCPDYLPIIDLFDSLAANFSLCFPYWPISYFFTLLNLRIDKLEGVASAITELEKFFIVGTLCKSEYYFTAAIENTYKYAAATVRGVQLFSELTYLFIKKSAEHKVQREVCLSFWAQPEFANQLYASDSKITLTIEQLVELYKIFDKTMTWRDTNDRDQFTKILLRELGKATETEQLKAIESLLFTKFPLSDMSLVNRLIKQWAAIHAKQLGEDDTTYPYYSKVSQVVLKVVNDAPGLYNKDMLEALAVGVVAQQKLCEFIAKTLEQQSVIPESMAGESESVLIKLAKHLAQEKVSLDCIQYLAYDLSQKGLDNFIKKMDTTAIDILSRGSIKHEASHKEVKALLLTTFYHMFWNRSMEERAVLFNQLMMPSTSLNTVQAAQASYAAAFAYVSKQLFPTATAENVMGEALLRSYLATGHEHVRPFILTAVITANKLIQGATKNITTTLPKLAEALGPAGVKAGQAAHSYPRTPADIRASLAHLKSQSRIPYRWELWAWIKTTVPSVLLDNIKRIKKLLGGASFYLAVEVEMLDGKVAVLRLMRKNAKQDAEHGFAHLKAMLGHCQHPDILKVSADLRQIVEEAEAGAKIEIDYGSVAKQYELATTMYKHQRHEVAIGKQNYSIVIQPVKLFEDGPGYQLISKAEGVEFNELKKDPKQRALCQAVALAVCKTELANMLGGGPCDFDRHGAQSRISWKETANGQFQVVVTNYDFGEVSPIPSTPAQLKHCQVFFNQAAAELMTSSNMLNTFFKGGSKTSVIEQFTEKLLTYLRDPKHAAHKEDLTRLRGIFKGLLALNDFFEVIVNDTALLNQLMPVIKRHLQNVPVATGVISSVYGLFTGVQERFRSGATNSNAYEP